MGCLEFGFIGIARMFGRASRMMSFVAVMASALALKGYDYKFVFGEGVHSGIHGGAILPESLEWLWSDRMAAEK